MMVVDGGWHVVDGGTRGGTSALYINDNIVLY
jgi:hypothetical protein